MLINYLIYFHQLDNFAALDRMNHGDLKATIAQIISIAKAHPEDPFYAIAQVVRTAPPAPAEQLGFQGVRDCARQFRLMAAEEVIGAGDNLESRQSADFRLQRSQTRDRRVRIAIA